MKICFKEISPCPLCSLFFLSLPLPQTHTQASPLCACTNTRKQIICRIQQCSFMSGRNTSNTWQQGQEQHKAEHRTKAKLVKGRKPFEFRGVTNYHVRKKHGATRSNTWQQDENNTKRNTEPSKASKKNLSRFENVTSSEALGERLQDEGERWPLLRLELNARVVNGRVPSRRLWKKNKQTGSQSQGSETM